MLYQLFANDMALFLLETKENFQAAREVVSIYERISGAHLNIDKSTIVPMHDRETLAWYTTTGCKVARPGEIISFLGCPIGVKISALKEVEFLMDKVHKRVNHWSNHLLTLQGRILLVRHIWKAIPVYHLMALTLT